MEANSWLYKVYNSGQGFTWVLKVNHFAPHTAQQEFQRKPFEMSITQSTRHRNAMIYNLVANNFTITECGVDDILLRHLDRQKHIS